MEPPRWPKLSHTNPADIKEHTTLLSDEFKAVQHFVSAEVSHIAPTLPKGIERKITKGIEKALLELESGNRVTTGTGISAGHRDFIRNTILEAITAEAATVFHNKVPQHLFKILQDSSDQLKLKIHTQEDAASQQSSRIAGTPGNEVLPHSPPDSPPQETDSELTDSELSCYYESDTEGLARGDWYRSTVESRNRAGKLKAQLEEVQRERKCANERLKVKAAKIEKELQETELDSKSAWTRYMDILEAMKKRRLEQDRTGDYGTDQVGYNVHGPGDFHIAKLDDTARRVILDIGKQAVVTRLFNMPAKILMRKVRAAVKQKSELNGNRRFPTITDCLGAELLDDGNIALWADSTDEYDWRNAKGDAFDGLEKMPFWDHDILASFASHVTERYEIYEVEVRDVSLEMLGLHQRKRVAALITDLVKQNVAAIPSLHIDVIKNMMVSRRTTYDNSKSLVLCFSNPVTANEVISHGLRWQGRFHRCEVHDPKFLNRCGRCQEYGHFDHYCTCPLRCGKCKGQHHTKLCTSESSRCALCDGPHRSRSSKCPAKRGRVLDKLKARFPTVQDHQPFALPAAKPEASRPSLSSPATNLPKPQVNHPVTSKKCRPDSGTTPIHTAPPVSQVEVEHPSTTNECHPDPAPSSVNTAPPDTPTLLARQLQDQIPAIEAALWSNISDMGREATLSATETAPQADDQKREKRRKLEEAANEVGLDNEIL